MSVTQDQEVEGSLVQIVHVDESGTDPVETLLALTTRDGLGEIDLGEDSESVNLSRVRRTQRYRTHNEPELEVASLLDVDMEAAELMGIQDPADGSVAFDSTDRRLGPDTYIHLRYLADEGDGATPELVHRFGGVEVYDPTIDPSDTPPILSFTLWIGGEIILDH